MYDVIDWTEEKINRTYILRTCKYTNVIEIKQIKLVALAFGLNGACRANELVNFEIHNNDGKNVWNIPTL